MVDSQGKRGSPKPGRGHTVMFVEDEPEVRESLAELLTNEGFNVVTATDGQDALEQLDSGFRPCLIILDLLMPRMDGVDLCRALHRDPTLVDIPVIVYSGAHDLDERTRDLGVAIVFQKPM